MVPYIDIKFAQLFLKHVNKYLYTSVFVIYFTDTKHAKTDLVYYYYVILFYKCIYFSEFNNKMHITY